ncbi:UNVERIFIED_CONTAM: hypothetical protein GTU68_053649 [Idotea baltica]|nr:hypothetical protein [Idotea baltica]
MLGAGALYFHLDPQQAVISDVNAQLIDCYLTIKEDVELLVEDLQTHVYESEYYYSIRNADREPSFENWSRLKRSSRFIYLNRTCFNGLYRVNSKGQFNVPIGRYKNPNICNVSNLRQVSATLKDTDIINCSFTGIKESVGKNDFVYLDPPYAPLSATANFTSYTKEPFDNSMQIKLRDFCNELDSKGAYFLLSNSSAPLVYDLYKEHHITEVSATRAINSSASKRGVVSELLIRNY